MTTMQTTARRVLGILTRTVATPAQLLARAEAGLFGESSSGLITRYERSAEMLEDLASLGVQADEIDALDAEIKIAAAEAAALPYHRITTVLTAWKRGKAA